MSDFNETYRRILGPTEALKAAVVAFQGEKPIELIQSELDRNEKELNQVRKIIIECEMKIHILKEMLGITKEIEYEDSKDIERSKSIPVERR